MRIHRVVKMLVMSLSGLVLCSASTVFAARIADISNTKHNFSALGPATLPTQQQRVVSATSEVQICVFCHTPHAANTAQTPLWNRALSSANYTTYSSSSLDSTNGAPLQQPNGVSKLCLSCHDGTMAIGAVNVLNGRYTDRNPNTEDIAMKGTSGGKMAPGEGITTGFTRYLGTDLTNDHPISVRFDANLALKDGDMRDPASTTAIAVRDGTTHPSVDTIVLQPDPGAAPGGGLVQCNSCHDPHIRDTTNDNIKFLRLNRLQKVDGPSTDAAAFSKANDIICLACHQKAGWAGSAHANRLVANEVYTNAAADVREFPRNTQVWQTACLACHDTHTVQGARRLIREGVDGGTINSSSGYVIKQGGNSAIEEGCYACHGPSRGTLQGQGTAGFEVPDTQSDFLLPRHMPITSADQAAGREVHDIGTNNPDVPDKRGADFVEDPQLLAGPNNINRHAECTDCHNPHRVIKKRHFSDNPTSTPDAAGTHDHSGTTMHTNIASGVLRGIWGVEPKYPANGTAFGTLPNTFDVKRGNPPLNPSTAVTSPYLTREYQLCFKCHSNYAFGTNPPQLGYYPGGTPQGTNGMTQYTNVAMEYQSPNGHQGEFITGAPTTPTGAATTSPTGTDFVTHNHRSWHPVMNNTGRTPSVRNANGNNWLTPWNNYVGTETMYCTDCHGTDTANGSAVPTGGENGNPWGPHGSTNNFLLKGPWSGDRLTGTGVGQPSHLCFKCHDYNQYGNPATTNIQNSGFALAGGNMCMMGGGGGGGMGGGGMGGGGGMMCMAMPAGMGGGMGGAMNNLHIFHANAVNNFRCNLCHIAVPHGWKNKVFLVNLNDTGPEIGNTAGTQVRNNTTAGFIQGPYYNRAVLKIRNFSSSGNWNDDNCGSAGAPGNGQIGVNWMAANSEACVDVP